MLAKVIEELRHEKEMVQQAIASLEKLQKTSSVLQKKRRGRKSMSPQERREVSARMRKYWASRLAKH